MQCFLCSDICTLIVYITVYPQPLGRSTSSLKNKMGQVTSVKAHLEIVESASDLVVWCLSVWLEPRLAVCVFEMGDNHWLRFVVVFLFLLLFLLKAARGRCGQIKYHLRSSHNHDVTYHHRVFRCDANVH